MPSGAGLMFQLVADVPNGLTLTPTNKLTKSLLGREAVHFQEIIKKSVVLVRKRTTPTERPPLVGEISTNFSRQKVSRGQRNESPRPLISVF
jgi:hypothetical protein